MKTASIVLCIALVGLPLAAGAENDGNEPEVVTVQHILIGFKKSIARKPGGQTVLGSLGISGYHPVATGGAWRPSSAEYVDRTKSEAKRLAAELLKRAQAGEDFAKLEAQYSDGDHPGVLEILNDRTLPLAGEASDGNLRRAYFPQRFGNVAFSLEVGEAGLAKYDASFSPYGWHIIKRIK
jgi:hypothetical protein